MIATTKRAAQAAMLTVDEARVSVIRSAYRCLTAAHCGPHDLQLLLWGYSTGPRRSGSDELLAIEHRRVLEAVAEAGHGGIILDELEGLIDAAGLRDGRIENLDVIAAQLDGAGYGEDDT